MLSCACKTVSALLLLNTAICLATVNNDGTNIFGIGFHTVTCGDRTYDHVDITRAIIEGIKNLDNLMEWGISINVMRYKPKPEESLSAQETYYFQGLNFLNQNSRTDLVVFTRNSQLAKVVTQIPGGREPTYVDCKPTQVVQSPERHSPMGQSPERQRHSPMGQSPERQRHSPMMQSLERHSPMTGSPQRLRPMMRLPKRDFLE